MKRKHRDGREEARNFSGWSEREEKSPLRMSDIIWHYCYLMGGISAPSAGGIRANAAAAVCRNLYPQLFLPRRSPPTLPDNPPTTPTTHTRTHDSGERGGGGNRGVELPCRVLRGGRGLVLLGVVVVVAVQGWMGT